MFRDLCRMPIAEKETLIWEALSIFHNSFFIYIMWNAFSRVVIYSSVRIYMLQYWVTACNCPSNKANSNVLFRSKKLLLTLYCTSVHHCLLPKENKFLMSWHVMRSGSAFLVIEETLWREQVFLILSLMSSWHVVLNFVILSDVRLLTAYLSQQTKLSSAEEFLPLSAVDIPSGLLSGCKYDFPWNE